MIERMVAPGEFYRHFKNKLYQIVAVATHSETGETMVVYQALYGTFRTYVRPLSMFAGPVDHEKYPEVSQQYRFERVNLGEEPNEFAGHKKEQTQLNPDFLLFLEAAGLEEKVQVLEKLKKTAGQRELDSLYVVLDIPPVSGSIERQLEGIRQYLHMQNHYDGGHLR